MYVKDYEFIYNIDVLFEKEIIIYGAGAYGRKTAELLGELSVQISCFCDRNGGTNKEYMSHPVIMPDELEQKTNTEDCLIIIGSRDYCQDIIEELQKKKINAYICTWYGIRLGIQLNIENIRVAERYKKDFIQRKETYLKNFELFDHVRYVMEMCKYPNAILVYQPAKVGSSAIHSALIKNRLESVQIHFIAYNKWINEMPQTQNREMAYFRNNIKNGRKKIKIITAVREPIGRALSQFVQGFYEDFSIRCNDFDVERVALSWVETSLALDYEFLWFDKELKEVTGIDIFQYPFDREQGYAWIKKDNIEILVLKVEKMNTNENIIADFVGKPDFKLAHANVGDEKCYKYIYKELKEQIRIPIEWLEQQYHNNSKVDYFYTKEEKEKFWKKWERKMDI